MTQQIKVRPAIHLMLDHFQAVHLPFDLAIAPLGGQGCSDRVVILPKCRRKVLQFLDAAVFRLAQPAIEPLGCFMGEHSLKCLGEVVDLFQLLVFGKQGL